MANVYGTVGDDVLENSINGTVDDDILYGYTGLNWFVSSEGSDLFRGGPGDDLIFYSSEPGPVTINNTGSDVNDVSSYTVFKSDRNFDTLSSIEMFHATAFDDLIYLNNDFSHYVFL